MKLMIFGYARHGKDTVADMLAKRFGLRPVSSSWFAAERIMMPYFALAPYASLAECYADRANHRKIWFDQIAEYNRTDLSRMARGIFAEYDIYVGIRNHREFNGAKCEGLFDYGIWVDRSDHLPAEDSSSNKMAPWMADYVLDNNGTLEELEARACALYERLAAKHETRNG